MKIILSVKIKKNLIFLHTLLFGVYRLAWIKGSIRSRLFALSIVWGDCRSDVDGGESNSCFLFECCFSEAIESIIEVVVLALLPLLIGAGSVEMSSPFSSSIVDVLVSIVRIWFSLFGGFDDWGCAEGEPTRNFTCKISKTLIKEYFKFSNILVIQFKNILKEI